MIISRFGRYGVAPQVLRHSSCAHPIFSRIRLGGNGGSCPRW
nr:MAG TPA: hypothetical protein [Bacteriophage sp.]DAW70541.1 MAG TPA: hypothetical protein [Caudoviricetes sp.]